MGTKAWAGLLAVLFGFSSSVWTSTDETIVFSDFSGQIRSIESYTGKSHWLVVMIWASDCHVCNMEAESYAQLHEANADQRIQVLGVSIDGEAKKPAARAFIQTHELPFPNLIGEPGTVGLYYAAMTQEAFLGTPSTMVFDPDGKLAAAQAGAVSPDAIKRYIAKKKEARRAS